MAASASDAHPYPIYNARYRVLFPILDADGDLVTGAASLDSELSQDCGTFADATNEATEIATSSGMYYLDLIATELDTKSTAVIVKTGTSGAKTTPMVLYPKRLPVVRTGTAQAGAASTITLDSGASAIDDFYNGCYVNITNNSPANALGQCRRIVDYVGSTKVATVEGTYGTNPSNASTFEILLTEEASSMVAIAGTAVVDPTTAGRLNVNTTHISNTAQTARDIGASVLLSSGTGAGQISLSSGLVTLAGVTHTGAVIPTVTTTTTATNVTTVNGLAANVITAASIAADAGAEIADAVWDEATAGHASAGTYGLAVSDILTDTAEIGAAGAGLTNINLPDQTMNITGNITGNLSGSVGSVTGAVGSVTGNVGGNVTGSVGSVTGLTNATIADAVWDEAQADHVAAGSFGVTASEIADILVDTAEIGAAGAGLSAIPWNAAWDAEVQSEVNDGLVAYDAATGTDVTTAAANVSVDEIQATALADLFNTDSGTTYASAVAGSVVKEIADNAGGSALTEAGIADAVWDELLSGHAVSGSAGEALSAAGTAGDPWTTALPGAYGAGTAGNIIGNNLNATVGSRATQTSVDTIDGIVDNILLDTAEIGAAGAGLTAINLPDQTMNITGNITGNLSGSVGSVTGAVGSVTGNVGGNVTGSVGSVAAGGIAAASFAANAINAAALAADAVTEIQSGLSTLDAAGVRTAVGLASANLDTQLGDLPTAVENADALLGRNVSGGSSAGRTVKQALHVLRNKSQIAAGTLTVYDTDDATSSWTAAVTTTAGDPISQIDPA